MMRTIQAAALTDAVAKLCIQANTHLPEDIIAALDATRQNEPWPLAKETLGLLWENMELAEEKNLPVCQDTGMACVFVELGQDVHIEGNFEEAIHQGVRKGYGEGFLRKSIVGDPLRRVNTEDNTPAAITVRLVPGDGCKVTVAPKGFGSENMSRLGMLKPADGVEGVKKFVVETVKLAGSNPCPPIVLGIGIGGSFDKVAYLAKHALPSAPWRRKLSISRMSTILCWSSAARDKGRWWPMISAMTPRAGFTWSPVPTTAASPSSAIRWGWHRRSFSWGFWSRPGRQS